MIPIELHQRRVRWALRKDSSPEGVDMEQASWGSRYGPELKQFKEHLDKALRHWIWMLAGAVWSQE